MTRAHRRHRRWWRNEDGAATFEFVIIVPVFLMLLMMGTESGLMLTRQVMLDRALDMTIRSLRLGNVEDPTMAGLRASICERTVVLANCEQNLLLELRRVDTSTWNYPTAPPACIDRAEEIAPVTEITQGGSNDVMIIRACMVVDPLFPTSSLGLQLPLDASGGFQLFSLSSFVNEPR